MQDWVIALGLFFLLIILIVVAIRYRAQMSLSANEIATITLSMASLFIAVLAYLQSIDNSDIKKAIAELTFLGKQTFRQANATNEQVRELAAQTAEMRQHTQQLRTSAASSVLLASNATAQLAQRERQFSLEQRPIIRWDPDSSASKDPISDDREKGILYWSYGLRNDGKSIAYNVTATEGISLWGSPFVETQRTVTQRYSPGEKTWSTAAVRVDPAALPIDILSKPTLRVRVRYSDVQGHIYNEMFCYQIEDAGGAIRDCSQQEVARLPSYRLDRVRPVGSRQ